MLDIKRLKGEFEEIEKRLKKRGGDFGLYKLIEVDEERKRLQAEVEDLKRKRNQSSDNIALIKRGGGNAEAEIREMKIVSDNITLIDKTLKVSNDEFNRLLLNIPNIPNAGIPEGVSSADNKVIKECGERTVHSFKSKSHIEIGEGLGILDFARGAKIAGTRFVVYNGLGARLERGLINFMLDIHTKEHGYKEIVPPFLVNPDSMTGTGQLPKFEEDLFRLRDDDFFLIPTAEVPLTNLYKDEILKGADLPIYLTAYTPCFRREAGSYGKETSGLIRQHQFNKVELVKFVEPKDSYNELEKLLQNAEEILKRLKIPYRVIELCAGDLGFSSAKTYDIEVWLPEGKRYVEISSCSNFEDFQARRARIRYKKDINAKAEYIHTLNGSGVAVGRLVVAILENYQMEDGSVAVPLALQEYMDGVKIIKK